MSTVGFYALIPVAPLEMLEWFGTTEFAMSFKQFLTGSVFLGAPPKMGQKNAILKICSCKQVHCAETAHFS